MSSSEDEDVSELEREKARNNELMSIIKGLELQVKNLTEQMSQLNATMKSMQEEKSTLLEMIKSKEIESKSNENGNVMETSFELTESEKKDNGISGKSDTQTDASVAKKSSETSTVTNGKKGDVKMNKSPSDDDEQNARASTSTDTNTIKRTNKVPPIDIWAVNRAEIQRLIDSTLPKDSCLFSRINNAKFRVIPRDATVRASVIEFLNERKNEFNTYTPSDEKIVNVLIRGLDHVDDEQIILDALAENNFVPHKVQKYVTGYMRHNKIKSNLWLITLQPNTDTNELFKIKAIEHAIIKWEFLKKPKIMQCKRCQRLFHSASNCKLEYRCVKCIEQHEPGQCKIDGNNKLKPKYVNCKGEHTANDFKNCPYFQKAIERQDAKSEKSKDNNDKNNKQTQIKLHRKYLLLSSSSKTNLKRSQTINKKQSKR